MCGVAAMPLALETTAARPGARRGPTTWPRCSRSTAALGADSVTAVVRVDNAASQALAHALDFAYERDVEHFGQPHRLYRRRAG